MNYRYKHNKISKILATNGVFVESLQAFADVAVDFFSSIFTSDQAVVDFNSIFHGVEIPTLKDADYR